MTIITTVFEYKDKPFDYKLLHEVFLKSVNKHMPDVRVISLVLDVPQAKDDRKPGLWTNTVKLREQVKTIESIDDDIVLADCDMLCLKTCEDIFNQDFDIGYTVKPLSKMTKSRINGGIIFVKNTQKAKDWMKELLYINNKMYLDPNFHNIWRNKYFGMNQSAMGYMIEASGNKAKTLALPTRIWNAVDCDWRSINIETRFVHIKGKLRNCILNRCGYPWMEGIMRTWYSYTDDLSYELQDLMPWDIKPQINQPQKKKRKPHGLRRVIIQ